MNAGPRWTLRLGAVLMALAPLLDDLSGGALAGLASVRPFSNSWQLGNALGLAGWRLCWVLPLAASFPFFRTNLVSGWLQVLVAGALFTLAVAALPSGTRPSGCLLLFLWVAAAFFLSGLALGGIELEVIGAWSRILLAVSLGVLAGFELHGQSGGPRAASAWMLAAAAAVCLAGEVWALAAVPPEERADAEPEA
jgi:hypothetical protein